MNRINVPQMEPWFDGAEVEAVNKYMGSGGWLMEYKETQKLEKMLEKFTKTSHAIMTNNGTVALTLALLALDLKHGDEVLVPDLTMIATPNSCAFLGLKPILVDISPENLCLNLAEAKKKITTRTKALIYVPLNGRSHDMKKVVSFCKKNGLFLVEDAAQALGSLSYGRQLGTFGDIGTLSFSTPKIITTGQGGALLTNSKRLSSKIRLLKNFGRTKSGSDKHDYWGWNFRFSDLHAVIGIAQMKKLKFRIKRKKEIYKIYEKELKSVNAVQMIKTDLTQTVPWFVDIYVSKPNKLMQYLKSQGVATRRIYPSVHRQKIYKDAKGIFPITDNFTRRGLWLPSSSNLTNEQVHYVTSQIAKYY